MLKVLFTLCLTMAYTSLAFGAGPGHAGPPTPNENKIKKLDNWNPDQLLGVNAAQIFVSSNTTSTIGVFDVTDVNAITMSTFPSVAADADGIFYDRSRDILFQLNRTDNVINTYSDICTTPTFFGTSTSGFRNGREIAVVGNKLVAVQDADANNGQKNKLVVYNISSSAAVSFDKAFVVNINLWGIFATPTKLYAVIDNSNQVAVFNDFFNQPAGLLIPDAMISIEGLIRTHGITYDEATDMLLLTDIGDAANDNDGALVMVPNFTAASADGMVTMSELGRAKGGASQLGNPVDVVMDKTRRRVYVAERANGGGKVLGFKLPILTGGIAPVYNQSFPGASAIHFSDANDMPNSCELLVDGGTVKLSDGNTETTIIIDGNPDQLSFDSTSTPVLPGAFFTYVVTDANGIILGIPPGDMVDFDPAGVGNCYVYGLSYTGDLNIMKDDDLFMDGLAISDKCFELSSNRIKVNRVSAQNITGQFFVSSNTQPLIGVYNIFQGNSLISGTIPSVAGDADGIYYDRSNDVLYQLNRTANVINAYSNVSTSPTLTATSTSDFTNGRGISAVGDQLVVTQDAGDANGQQNRLLIYTISATSITLVKAFDVDINLWGVHANGNTLYAVVDNSNTIAVFNDFFNQPAGALTPNAIVTVENLVRTHGITYDAPSDMMLLTDIGDAASATDGALVMIPKFTMASVDNMITAAEQGRASGGASQLGNPVDVVMDTERRRVYVAERANGGGKVLGFKLPILTGGIAPVFSSAFPGASAIYFSGADDVPAPAPLVSNTPEVLPVVQAQVNVDLSSQVDLIVKNIYPIPAIDRLNVSLNSAIEQEAIIGIFNAAGKLMIQKRVDLYTGDNVTDFEVSDWPSGMYFLRIPGLNVTSKFVKASKQ